MQVDDYSSQKLAPGPVKWIPPIVAIPDDEWDRHVAETTQFDDWSEMQSKAGTEWAVDQLRN